MGNTNENFNYGEVEDFLMQDATMNQGVHHNRSDNISPTIPRGDFVPINRSLSPPGNQRGYWARNAAVSPTLDKSAAYTTDSRSVSPTSKRGFWANDGWSESNQTILAKFGGSGVNNSGLSVNNGIQGGGYSSNAVASSGGTGMNMSTGNFSTGNNGVSINGGGFSSANNGVSINRGGFSTSSQGVSVNGGGYSTGNQGVSLNGGNSSMITTSRSIGNTSLAGPNINAGTNGISLGGGQYSQSESYQVNTGGIHGGVGDFSIGGGGNETIQTESNRKVTFATNDNGIVQHGQSGGVQVVEETTTTHGGATHSNVPFGIERMFTEQDSYVDTTTMGRSREGTGVSLGQAIKTRAVVHHVESPSEVDEGYTVTETVHTEHKAEPKNEIIVQTQQPWQQKVGEWKTTSVTSSPRVEKPGMSYDLWETESSPQPEFHQTHRSEITESYDEPITSNAYTVTNSMSHTPRAVKTVTTKSTTRHHSETDLVLPLDDVDNYETETHEVVVHKPSPPPIKEFIQPPETRTIVKQTVVTETPRIETKYVEYKPPTPPPPPKQFIVKQPPKVETHYIEYETTPPPIQRIVVKKPPRVETRYVEYEQPPPTTRTKEVIVRRQRPSPPPVKREINYVEYNKTPRQSEVSYEYHTIKPRYTYSPPKPRVIVEEHVKKYVSPKPEIRTTYNVTSDYLAPTKASSLKSLHRTDAENNKINLPPLQASKRRSFTTIDRTNRRGSYDVVKAHKTSSLDEVRYGGHRSSNNESVTIHRSYKDAWTGANKNGSRTTTTTTTSHNGTTIGVGDGAATIKFTRPVTVVQDVPTSNITNLYTQYRQANNTRLVPL